MFLADIGFYDRDETEICAVQSAGIADVEDAIRAARRATKSWKRVSGTDRGRLLYKLSDLVEQHATELATIDAWDSGTRDIQHFLRRFADLITKARLSPLPFPVIFQTVLEL